MTRARELGKLANKNTLTADNTNNFVGIASTQPTTRLDVVGVVSATSFSGDGSGLTGVASTDNIITGTAATFNNTTQFQNVQLVGVTTGLNVSGVATFANNVSIAGTLTYEDVTNVDSLGIVTARSGVEFGASGVGGTITAAGQAEFAGIVTALGVNVSGIVTAASFQGSGADLTNLPASGDSNDITASLFL